MDDLISKAVDVLGPLQSQALNAIDSTLNEYPVPEEGEFSADHLLQSIVSADSDADEIGLAPSAVDAAKRVLQYWEELDIEGKKCTWDEEGVAISHFQDISAKNRKALAEQTRAFKSGDKKDFIPLLKAYQAEIDSMTKRSKHAENAYLAIYKLLYDAPDVVPSLKAFVEIADRVSHAEQEARRSRQELEVVRSELNQSRSALLNLRRLEERNAVLEKEMNGKVESIVEEKEKQIRKELEASALRESALSASLVETKESLLTLQRKYDNVQSQLFDLEEIEEEKVAKKQDELERAMDELERAQERVKSLELSRAELASELDRVQRVRSADVAAGEGSESLSEMERSLNSKDKFIAVIGEQVQQLEGTLAAEREAKKEAIQKLEEQLANEKSLSLKLTQQISEFPTMEEFEGLKEHNKVLQELVGSEVDSEPDASGGLSLETALKRANRKLTTELTNARIAVAEQKAELDRATERSAELENRNGELEALVAQLEEDIVKGSVLQSRDGWKSSPSSGMDSLLGSQLEAKSSPRGAESVDEGGAMLEIVCGQRERFRKRVQELESENGALKNSLVKSNAEVTRLKGDNVSLYEKIKFLEQYNRQGAPVKRVGGSNNGDVVVFGGTGSNRKNSRYACFGVSEPGGFDSSSSAQDLNSVSASTTETRYRKLYEEKMNPFNEFHSRERERSYKNLRLHDKITLSGGRFILTNKYGRLFVFVYTILLHLFVFFVLYQSSTPNTVVIQNASSTPVLPSELFSNSTMASNYTENTFAESVAEKMGTFIQKTRDLTNRGSSVSSEQDLKEASVKSKAKSDVDDMNGKGTLAPSKKAIVTNRKSRKVTRRF